MGMVILPPGVTWEQYNYWLQNTPEGQQYSQYINQASAGSPTGVSHAPPMQSPGAFRPQGQGRGGYDDIADLMQQYPGVDPESLRRYRENQKRAEAEDAAKRFSEDSQQYDPEYRRKAERARRADELAREQEQFAEQWKNSQPGRAQPIQPQSQGTPMRPPVGVNPPVVNPPLYGSHTIGPAPIQDTRYRGPALPPQGPPPAAGQGGAPPQMKPPGTAPKWGSSPYHLF